MRVIILTCLIASALAIPQGYNYQQQHSNSLPFVPSSLSSSSSSSSHNSVHEGQQFLKQAFQSPRLTQTLLSGGHQQSFARPQQPSVIPQSFGIQPQIQSHHHQPHYQPQPQQLFNNPSPVVTKDIFVHVAPEEPEERYIPRPIPVAPPRKHYRIVFIKAPSHKITQNAVRVQQAPSEEKTIIYVLTKKPDPIDLESAIQEVPQKPPSKPEVYFIKYKTQEEAQHAQRTIQAQYDKLGGTTQVSDEGVAPVTSVIGSLDQQGGGGGGVVGGSHAADSSGGTVGNTGASAESTYLPPIRI